MGASADATGDADAALAATFARILDATLADDPELATGLGLDTGANAALRARLSDGSAAARDARLVRTRGFVAELDRHDPRGLGARAALDHEVVRHALAAQTVAPERFGIDSLTRPYRLSQQSGAYYWLPDFLTATHPVADRADAEAWLARLAGFARALDDDSEEQRAQAARGMLAPGFALDLTLGQLARLRADAAEGGLVRALADRAAAAGIVEEGIAGDWAARAAAIVAREVLPGLDRQSALVAALRRDASEEAGLWRLADGEALYAAALAEATTTALTPAEVHRLGEAQVAELGAQVDTILRGQGLTVGSLAARLAALNEDAAQVYADDAAGREALIAGLNADVGEMMARLPAAFTRIPAAPLAVRAVPDAIQDGASGGYYRAGALDGSRPACYFINLKRIADWPRYSLPALTYHEGVPGHHLQIGIAQGSGDIPTIRKISMFEAYAEGWALYAEQLADELGGYATPLARAGYLQSFLFRAARLVIDTGLHTRRWSRARAVAYLIETVGLPPARAAREIERYAVQPAQACSYKVGHIVWARARAAAQAALGTRFDLARFHAILSEGAMPLSLLERRLAAWAERERVAA